MGARSSGSLLARTGCWRGGDHHPLIRDSSGHGDTQKHVREVVKQFAPPEPSDDYVAGKRKRKTVYGKTKREAQEKLTRLQNQKLDGALSDESKLTVVEYLERWLNDSVRLTSSDSTHVRYEGVVRNYINPAIGGVRLSKLSPSRVQSMFSAMEQGGATANARGYTHSVINQALNVALKWGLVVRNACGSLDRPKTTKRGIQPLTAEEAQRLLVESESHRLHALFVLAVATGIRQGELFALHWPDIDLDRGTISVRHTLEEINGRWRLKEPKTASSRRLVTLPRMAVDALIEHRKRILAKGWAGIPWVFVNTQGTPLLKTNFYRYVWKPLRKAAGIHPIRFHDLRHTQVTLLLSLGENPKVVQERLGHAKISMTLDTYSHVIPGMQQGAADKLDSLYLGRKSPDWLHGGYILEFPSIPVRLESP